MGASRTHIGPEETVSPDNIVWRRFSSYDPSVREWRKEGNGNLFSNDVQLTNAAASNFKEFLITSGGYNDDWTTSNCTYMYHTLTNEWQKVKDMGTLNDKVYSIGGCNYPETRAISDNEVFDVVANEWTIINKTLNNLSRSKKVPLVATESRLMVLGGHDLITQEDMLQTEWFDPREGFWQNGSKMPLKTVGFGAWRRGLYYGWNEGRFL